VITVFAVPKPFRGHIGIIQLNAIRSWARLPGVNIILLGDEVGTEEVAAEIGAIHLAEVERNEFGTPYVSSCFSVAMAASETELMAYVNADIILMSDFGRAVERASQVKRPFLLAGRRTDLDLARPLTFSDGWERDLRDQSYREGKLGIAGAIDYFVFRKDLWPRIPPFAIGRWCWDNWLLYDAVERGATLIDASREVQAVHQYHGYEHSGAAGPTRRDGPEAHANYALHPDSSKWYDLNHASRVLHPVGLLPAWTRVRLRQRFLTWLHRRPRFLKSLRRLKRMALREPAS
jgi:hypothetical protein